MGGSGERPGQPPPAGPRATRGSTTLLTRPDADDIASVVGTGMLDEERTITAEANKWLTAVFADRDWLERLRAEGFQGPRYEMLATGLVGYGYPVLAALIRTRRVFVMTRRQGRPVPLPPAANEHLHDPEVRLDLAEMTSVVALRLFRIRALEHQQWDPRRGASLTTYFVGAEIRAFPNVYRQWLSTFLSHYDRTTSGAVLPEQDTVPDPATTVCATETIEEILALATPRQRETLLGLAAGLSYDELGHRLNVKPDALRQDVSRFRTKLRRERGST